MSVSRSSPFVLLVALAPVAATAHPDMVVETRMRLVLDEARRLAGIEIAWAFDPSYSLALIASGGLDADGDGSLTPSERADIVAMHTTGMAAYGWFTHLAHGAEAVALASPDDVEARLEEGRIVLAFTARPERPVDLDDADVVAKVYDPSLTVGFVMEANALGLDAPEGCAMDSPAGTGRFAPESVLALDLSPAEGASLAEALAPPVRVSCR